MLTPDQIRTNFAAVDERVAAACRRAGRERHEVTLVAVTKTFPAEAVSAVIAAGATHVGENRVQEARDKKPLAPSPAVWHLIGGLQSNKARDAVRLFDVIQTLDSPSLAERLARYAAEMGKVQRVLIEVNVGDEPQKSGVQPADVEALVKAIRSLDALRLTGLMTIPPWGEPESMRPFFRTLRKLRDDLGVADLSMGMTDDFEAAIEEGATIVRVGRAIFGARG